MRKGFTRRPKVEEPAANHGKNYITPGGIERLKDERHFLLTKDRPAVVEVVAWAAGNGDRSENADYQYSKRRLRQIDGRVRFLTKRIEAAEVVDPEAPRTGQRATRAFFGATVRYANAARGERVVSIVGTDEVNLDRNHISWASPLGRALMRATEDDEVVLHAPGGTETLTVLDVWYERIAVDPGERELRQVTRSNAGRREAANQVRAHLEVIEHSQAAVPARNLPALQMYGGDHVRHHLVVAPDVGAGTDKLDVPARAGEILPELGQSAGRRTLVVVERVVRERVADQ